MSNRPPLPLIKIPYDSNLRYLPLVYFLPEDRIAKYPTLRALPRKVREVIYDDNTLAVVESDAFLKEVTDAAAALVFPHFGFGGWIEHYTGYCPVWKLSYALPVWSGLLEKEIGWGLQALMLIPSSESIPFFDPAYIKDVTRRVVKRGIAEQNWQPVLDVVKEFPCAEDFEEWNTNVRKDFHRKWYHTRSKKVQTVSLEELMEDEENGVHEIAANIMDVTEKVAADDFVSGFREKLSAKDWNILVLRDAGFTYERIASGMGYKNHSGVIKRIRAIAKEFDEYENERR